MLLRPSTLRLKPFCPAAAFAGFEILGDDATGAFDFRRMPCGIHDMYREVQNNMCIFAGAAVGRLACERQVRVPQLSFALAVVWRARCGSLTKMVRKGSDDGALLMPSSLLLSLS